MSFSSELVVKMIVHVAEKLVPEMVVLVAEKLVLVAEMLKFVLVVPEKMVDEIIVA